MIEEPTVKQKTNMRVFAGFTPQQVEKLLTAKGLKPNSREAAVYLSAMSDKAEQMLMDSQVKAFQYGGAVGGFDDKSSKLFDAAVKRTASTEPKSPEVQRYIDNVIETRGRPTMVFPGTTDPLQGYQQGGSVNPGEQVAPTFNLATPLITDLPTLAIPLAIFLVILVIGLVTFLVTFLIVRATPPILSPIYLLPIF